MFDSAPNHYTAWLVNNPADLDTEFMDVTVLQDELRGEPDDPHAWFSFGDPMFRADTTVRAEDGDIEEAMAQAEALLCRAGWSTVGDWDVVPNALIITVTRKEAASGG